MGPTVTDEVFRAIPERRHIAHEDDVQIQRDKPRPKRRRDIWMKRPQPPKTTRATTVRIRDVYEVVPRRHNLHARIDPTRVIGDAEKPMRLPVASGDHR